MASRAKPAPGTPSDAVQAAERGVLGALMTFPDAPDRLHGVLSAEDFWRPTCAEVFAAVWALVDRGDKPEPVAVADELTRTGSALTLADLLGLVSEGTNTGNYLGQARLVRRAAALRTLTDVSAKIAELVQTGATEPDEVALAGLRLLDGVLDRSEARQGAVRLADGLESWLDGLETRLEGPTAGGVPSGWRDLDAMVGGFRPGQLVVLGGRPGHGKSDVSVNLAIHAASLGIGVLVVSVEMGLEELEDRFVASVAKLDRQQLKRGVLSDAAWARLSHGLAVFADAPLWVLDDQSATLATVRGEIRRRANRGEHLGLVIVDYLQLLETTGKSENRQTEVADLSRGLKRLARDADLPVVALSSLSRSVEQRGEKRPILSDLRETGSIEADANVVLFLYRDEVYNPRETRDRGICEVIVAKQRNGPTGTVRLLYDAKTGRFSDIPLEEQVEPLSMSYGSGTQ